MLLTPKGPRVPNLRLGVCLLCLLCPLALAACAEEDPTVDDPFEGAATELDVDPEEWELYDFSQLELPHETPEECVEVAADLYGDIEGANEGAGCICENCLDLQQECDALPGCIEIRRCALETGCTDEFSCYLLPGAPCVEVTDQWGNAGVAAAVSLELNRCSSDSECQ